MPDFYREGTERGARFYLGGGTERGVPISERVRQRGVFDSQTCIF